jgi:hypothetical protein
MAKLGLMRAFVFMDILLEPLCNPFPSHARRYAGKRPGCGTHAPILGSSSMLWDENAPVNP